MDRSFGATQKAGPMPWPARRAGSCAAFAWVPPGPIPDVMYRRQAGENFWKILRNRQSLWGEFGVRCRVSGARDRVYALP
jgi:hypothetical protein